MSLKSNTCVKAAVNRKCLTLFCLVLSVPFGYTNHLCGLRNL